MANRNTVNLLGLLEMRNRQTRNTEKQTMELMDMFSKSAIQTGDFEGAMENVDKIKGISPFTNEVGDLVKQGLAHDQESKNLFDSLMKRADEIEQEARTVEINNKSEFTDLMDDLLPTVYTVMNRSNTVQKQAIKDKFDSLYTIRKEAETAYDTQLASAFLKRTGTAKQKEYGVLLDNLSSTDVEDYKQVLKGNILSATDMLALDQKQQKLMMQYGPSATYEGGRLEMDKAVQQSEQLVKTNKQLKIALEAGGFETKGLFYTSEKSGDTPVNRSSLYYPEDMKETAKIAMLPFFTTDAFTEVLSEHINKELENDGFTTNEIAKARGGDVSNPRLREIANYINIFEGDDDAPKDAYIEKAIDIFDNTHPDEQFNKFFAKMTYEKDSPELASKSTFKRTLYGPMFQTTYRNFRENYFNWKKVSDSYKKLNPQLNNESISAMKRYDRYDDATDLDEFYQMLNRE